MEPCPSEQELNDFLADRLKGDAAAALEVHVENCASCQEALAKLIAVPLPLSPNSARQNNVLPEADVAFLARVEKSFVAWQQGEPTEAFQTLPTSNSSGLESAPELAGYEILEVLGRGGMGVVYRAWQTDLKRVVAIKMILAGGQAGSDDRARFRTEAEAAGRLQHPHIVQVHEIGEQNGIPYLVLEFVNSDNLARHLGGASMLPRQAAQLVETLARTMHYAHQRGIIHRDLKPANVLLQISDRRLQIENQQEDPSSRSAIINLKSAIPKISDFGLAKLTIGGTNQTQTGAILGTPSYMAPEQAEGRIKDISKGVDIYALGAILYELLTGRPPFQGETAAQTLQKVLTVEPVAPHWLQPNIPRDLETICLKCLEKDPGRRYDSALDLAEDARRFLQDEPIRARPISTWQWLCKWAKRKPAIAALAVVVVLSAALLAGGSWWYQGRLDQTLAEVAPVRDEAWQNLYLAHIPLAQRAWEAARVERVRDLLESVEPRQEGQKDFRDFEWHYLRRLLHTNLVDLTGPRAPVMAMAFSPDGRRLASANADGSIHIWDPDQGKELLPPLKAHAGRVTTVAYSPDGQLLASGGIDQQVCLWDAAGGRLARVVGKDEGLVHQVAFSPSGAYLATVSADKSIKIWDLKKGGAPRTLPAHAKVSGAAFSHDGKSLATAGSDWLVRLWDLDKRDNARILAGHGGWVYSVVFSPDDKTLYSSSIDNTVRVWDTRTGVQTGKMVGHAGLIRRLALSPDGSRLASASFDQTVGVWDTAKGSLLMSLKGHVGNVQCVAFHPDGRRLASAGADHTIRIWDIREFQDFHLGPRHEFGPISAVALRADNQKLYSAGADGKVQVWDLLHAKAEMSMACSKKALTAMTLSPNGKFLATGGMDKVVRVWDLAGRKVLHQWKGHTGRISALAFRPDGEQLVSSSFDGTLRVWSMIEGVEKHNFAAHVGQVRGVAFSPDGQWLASCGGEKMVYLWDTANWEAPPEKRRRSFKGHTGMVQGVAFSPDGQWLASASADGSIIVWDVAAGKHRFKLERHSGRVQCVAFSPNGQRLASAGYVDKAVKIWDLKNGQELLSLNHQSHAIAVAFSADGHLLVSAGEDPAVRIWDGTPLP